MKKRFTFMVRRRARLVFFVLSLMAITKCNGPGPMSGPWNASDAPIVGPAAVQVDSVQVDVYLDATTSMTGYIADGNSTYLHFLNKLESSVEGGWSQARVHYFKFGSIVRSVEREALLKAGEPAFYRERGLFETTSIDSVIERTNPDRVSVIVTDLFQDDGDVNAIVARIKDRCFRRGIQVAILGIPSEFDGTVYDAKVPPYRYAATPGQVDTYRPFYALMFGKATNLERLFEALKNEAYVQERYFTLISPYIVQGYEIELAKTPASRDLNVASQNGSANQYAFNLRKGGTGGELLAEVVLHPKSSTPTPVGEQVELTSYRKIFSAREQAEAADSVRTDDFKLASVRVAGDTLRATLRFVLTETPGIYAYRVFFQTGTINGLTAPPWVADFSSDNPSPTSDPNKTLNLHKFVSDLTQASVSVQVPKLAQAYITVRKL